MLPSRRPRLMAQRHEARASAVQTALHQQAVELAAERKAGALERDRARRRKANSPTMRVLETAAGWALSILGALSVSILLTWLVRHPQVLDSLASAARSILHVK